MVKLKGKYLEPLKKFVSSFPFSSWNTYRNSDGFDSLIDTINSIHGKFLHKHHAEEIVLDVIINFIYENELIDLDIATISDERITELQIDLLEKLTFYIESLPREYVVHFPIQDFPDWGGYEIEITDRIKLISDSSEFKKDHDFDFLNPTAKINLGLLSIADALYPKPKLTTYLSIKCKGYGTTHPNSPATAEAISIAKQCAFLLETFNVMNFSYVQNPQAKILTIKPKQKEASRGETITLPESIAKCLALKPNEASLQVEEDGATLITRTTRPATTNEEKISALSENLSPIKTYFTKQNHSDFTSLCAGIEWYQDSRYSHNDTFAYLAACIGLEALLGTDDFMDNMSKRLADRYASIMGKGRTERNDLAKKYERVLKIRGQLVHAKEAKLNTDLQSSLLEAQSMLHRLVLHELNQIYKSK